MADVSICIITFNQQKFIRQAIEGAIFQQSNFEKEIIIVDDASTDGTSKICEEMAVLHGLKYFRNETNLGMIENWKKGLRLCNGKYIALCEGDDFWTSPFKLEKQLSILEEETNISLVFHKVKVIDDKDRTLDDIFNFGSLQNETYEMKDLAKRNFIPTASAVFRNFDFFSRLPRWIDKLPMIDWPIMLLVAQKGNIKFINEELGAYRKHSNGIWSSKNYVLNIRKMIYSRKLLNKNFGGRYKDQFLFSLDAQIERKKLIDHYKYTRNFIKYFGHKWFLIRTKKTSNSFKNILKIIYDF